jgi:CPA2 family monovalent cation:H+ antiporter-2
VIICGYGRSGQNLARMLEREASPTWRWTWTPTACARPPPPARLVVFGDATRLQA